MKKWSEYRNAIEKMEAGMTDEEKKLDNRNTYIKSAHYLGLPMLFGVIAYFVLDGWKSAIIVYILLFLAMMFLMNEELNKMFPTKDINEWIERRK